MENASKALIMAGSVLIALMIIGALLLMFNNLSNYQNTGTQNTREAQVIEFNNQYETYIRDNIRGSDMISLMNRIIDYNTRKGDNSEEQYQEMKIKISGIVVNNLKYDSKDNGIIKESYTQDDINELLTKVQELENNCQSEFGVSITTLSTNISKVMETKEKAMELLPTNKKNKFFDEKYNLLKEYTAEYYQYSQFKRVYFNCETDKVKYNSKTGRIIYLEFTCTNQLG